MLLPADLKALRKHLGETQLIFAARFGVDQATIHRWETDGIPDVGAARVAVERFAQDFRAMYPNVEINAVAPSAAASEAVAE